MERISWIKNGSVFRKVEGSIANIDSIPVGIYNVNFNPMSGWSLEQTGEKFTFNYKIYGLQSNFIDYVLKTFENTKGNLGILLNGVKGTGKSVVAKILANKFNLPIIIVKSFGDDFRTNGIKSGKSVLWYKTSDGNKIASGLSFLYALFGPIESGLTNTSKVTQLHCEKGSKIALDFNSDAVRAAFQILNAYNPNLFLNSSTNASSTNSHV